MSQKIKPLINKESYYKLIDDVILSHLREGIYAPLFAIMSAKPKAMNNMSTINEALENGVIYYDDRIQGFKAVKKFGNKISKALENIGAKYDARQKCYKLKFDKLPTEILVSIARVDTAFADKVKLLQTFLLDVQNNVDLIVESMVFNDQLEVILDDEHNEIQKTVRNLNIIEPQLSETQQQDIIRNYTTNMRYKIADWLPNKIESMRQKVQKLVLDGYRQDAVEKMLIAEYGAAVNKAKFWARNETSLMLAEYKRTEYKAMGFTKFIWKTRQDPKVREDHADLNGRTFFYDQPPVVDKRTGQAGLPGQSYNCRCLAIPVM